MYKHLIQMGTDPRCMVGWDKEVKLFFFLPVIVLSVLSVVLMIIVHCNLKTSTIQCLQEVTH